MLKIRVREAYSDDYLSMWNSLLWDTSIYKTVAWYAGTAFYDYAKELCRKYADSRDFSRCRRDMDRQVRTWNGDLNEDIDDAIRYSLDIEPTRGREFEVDGFPYRIFPDVSNGRCSFRIMKNTPDMVANPGIRSAEDVVAETGYIADVTEALHSLEALLEDTFG